MNSAKGNTGFGTPLTPPDQPHQRQSSSRNSSSSGSHANSPEINRSSHDFATTPQSKQQLPPSAFATEDSSVPIDASNIAKFATPTLGSSPHVSSETPNDDHNEFSSLGLMNSSFDTLSDGFGGSGMGGSESLASPVMPRESRVYPVGHQILQHHHTPPLTAVVHHSASREQPLQPSQQQHHQQHHHHHHESSDASIGDISPIKVIYTTSSAAAAAAGLPVNTSAATSALFRENREMHHGSNQPKLEQALSPRLQLDSTSKSATMRTRYVREARRDTSVIPMDWMPDNDAEPHDSKRSNPIYVLKSSRRAFENVKYLLPCLSSTMGACPVNMSDYGSIRQYRGKQEEGAVSADLIVATRRVESAICAFGGTVNVHRNQQTWSIFRHKSEYIEARQNYEQQLPSRYHVSDSSVSWEFEVESHVYVPSTEDSIISATRGVPSDPSTKRVKSDHSDDGTAGSSSTAPGHDPTADDPQSDAAKMRYKCKLCGQLKQNHSCPYQQPLQRNIGVMVYPAVNAFTASEPAGACTPALTKMNNFVSYYSDPQLATYGGGENTPRPTRGSLYAAHPSTITPETPRAGPSIHSPQSSLSAQSSSEDHAMLGPGPPVPPVAPSHGWKRSNEHMLEHSSHSRSPFVASVALRPEQYRAVTPFKKESVGTDGDDGPSASATASSAYQYPAVPLSFAERKRMSDTLFYLSKEIPSMTHDCAGVLREARHNNEWDLAVAELLAQLVVGLYCSETDARLDGLQRYLLNIGISC